MATDEGGGIDARALARAVEMPYPPGGPAFQSTGEGRAERLRRVRIYADSVWRGQPIDFDAPEPRQDEGVQVCYSCGGEVDVAGGDLRYLSRAGVDDKGWRCEACAAVKRKRA